jgi:hypothetical protein
MGAPGSGPLALSSLPLADGAVNPLRVLQEAAIAHRDSDSNGLNGNCNQQQQLEVNGLGVSFGQQTMRASSGLADGGYFQPGRGRSVSVRSDGRLTALGWASLCRAAHRPGVTPPSHIERDTT